jgi:hypothetical protein
MDSESSLYQKVWGEPDRDGRVPDPARASSYESDPVDQTRLYSSDPPEPLTSWADAEDPGRVEMLILRRLEQMEERVSKVQRSAEESRQLLENGFAGVADALKSLESRMNRLEKGVVRSLEYLESRIEALGG